MALNIKAENIKKRKRRIRAKISGTAERPRLAIFKSNKTIYAQIIDDEKGNTLVSFSGADAKGKTPLQRAKEVGIGIAKLAKDKKIVKVVFDRGGFIYTGHIKELAGGAREGGLEF